MKKQFSILIVDDDEVYAKQLASYAKSEEYIIAADFAADGEKGIEAVAMTSPDVVVLDSFMPRLDGLGFLRKLKAMQLKQKPIIIMNSEANFSNLINSARKNGADYFMLKPQSNSGICRTALDLFSAENGRSEDTAEEAFSLEKSVTAFLHGLGMPSHLDGYKYMKFAIMKTVDEADVLNPITKKLYPMTAEKFSTTKECVERAIRHAVSVSWKRGNKKQIKDIFGYTADTEGMNCPTNSEYIAMVSDDFRLRLRHGMLCG